MPLEVVAEFVERLGGGIRVLQIDGRRMSRYQSVYFDTPGGSFYLAAARRRRRRYKVRGYVTNRMGGSPATRGTSRSDRRCR